MDKTTQELLHNLTDTKDIECFLNENEAELITENVQEYIKRLSKEKNIKTAQIAISSEKGDYLYKVLRGERRANRDLLICISLGMQMSLSETQLMLRIAKLSRLDPRDKRDAVVLYAIGKKLTVLQTNEILTDICIETF